MQVPVESKAGARIYAEARLSLKQGDWLRYDFTLSPSAGDDAGRFAVKLKGPGSVSIGHAFLQPGGAVSKACQSEGTLPKD